LPLTVEEVPRETVVAESVRVTLLAEVEETLEAVVLAVTSPVAAPIARVLEVRLVVPPAMEPVIPIVPVPAPVEMFETPVPAFVRAPAILMVPVESVKAKTLPLATDEVPSVIVGAVSIRVTLLPDAEVMDVAFVVTVPEVPISPDVVLAMLRLVAVRVVVPEAEIWPVVTPMVPAVKVAEPEPARLPVMFIVFPASEMIKLPVPTLAPDKATVALVSVMEVVPEVAAALRALALVLEMVAPPVPERSERVPVPTEVAAA
jgi:hypothetical protein